MKPDAFASVFPIFFFFFFSSCVEKRVLTGKWFVSGSCALFTGPTNFFIKKIFH